MNIVISITCKKCGAKTEAPIKRDNNEKYYLSDSIEDKQEGFYCNLDQQHSMKVNCSCGNEVRLHY